MSYPMGRVITSIDLFAGAGGASRGILEATGTSPILAINHDEHAIEMHTINHPAAHTLHLCMGVEQTDCVAAVRGKHIDLAWFSPDCTHFSKAKGGKPLDLKIRSLAWEVPFWAESVRPDVICLENVPEFVTWGPLHGIEDCTCGSTDKDPKKHPKCLYSRPIKAKKGETFKQWVRSLRALGYDLQWKTLIAADYGAPTTRKRLFVIARCDGKPIRWPRKTHGPGREFPHRTAAEVIDWSIPTLSIFATKEECKRFRRDGHSDGTPIRPLAEATQARIAEGMRRFVLESDDPYLTYMEAHGALSAPTMIQTGFGERKTGKPQRPRYLDLHKPLGTVVSGGSKHALVSAFLSKHYGGPNGNSGGPGVPLHLPAGTVTGRDSTGLTAVFLDKAYSSAKAGTRLNLPTPTVTSGGNHLALVAAFITKYYGSGGRWSGMGEPMHTIVTKARMGLVTIMLEGEEYLITDIGMRMLQPRELARAQGFNDSYVLTGTKSQQIARIGNSVPPPMVKAIVQAQFGVGTGQIRRVG